MKTKYLYIFLMLLTLWSCRKEDISDIYEEEKDDPVLVDTPAAIGVIYREGKGIADVTIDIYQNNVKVGTVKSDINGKFTTLDIDLLKTENITLYCRKIGFVSVAKRMSGTGNVDLKIEMVAATDSPISPAELLNPGDESLVIISGYVKDGNGKAQQAQGFSAYNVVETSPGQYTYDGAVFVTDDKGYYEFLAPKNTQLYLQIKQTGCQPMFLTKAQFKLFSVEPAEIIGPFASDTKLTDINNGLTYKIVEKSFKLVLTPQQCLSGDIIQFGKVIWRINIFNQSWNFSSVINGNTITENFTLCIPESDVNKNIDVLTTVYDDTNLTYSEEVKTILWGIDEGSTTNIGTIKACIGDPSPGYSFELTIDGTLYQSNIFDGVPLTNAAVVNDVLVVPSKFESANARWIKFNLKNFSTGNNKLSDFRYLGNDGYYNQKDQVITMSITSNTDQILVGTIDGKIFDEANSRVVPIIGKFKFRYE
jgi:hypothetical protein